MVKNKNIVYVTGYAGVGKTTFAHALAQTSGWAILDKDTLTKKFVETLLLAKGTNPNDRESSIYVNEIKPLEYEVLEDTIFENICNKTPLIVVAPFVSQMKDSNYWMPWKTYARAHGMDIVTVWVKADKDTMLQNITYRNAERDANKLSDWGSYLESIDPNLEPDTADYIVDNNGDECDLINNAKSIYNDI